MEKFLKTALTATTLQQCIGASTATSALAVVGPMYSIGFLGATYSRKIYVSSTTMH